MSHWQGTVRTSETSTGKNFYTKYDATTVYTEKAFGFRAQKISLINETDHKLQWSFDGVTLHGELPVYGTKDINVKGHTSIYVRVDDATGTNSIHISAS